MFGPKGSGRLSVSSVKSVRWEVFLWMNVTGTRRKKKLHKDFGKQRETARNRILVPKLVVSEADITPIITIPLSTGEFRFYLYGLKRTNMLN